MPSSDDITLRSRKLLLAGHAFRHSHKAVRYLLDNNITDDLIYESFVTSACVVYCRPFTKSSFYGKLGDRYQRFSERPDLQDLHQDIWKGRNWIFAHAEPGKAAELFGGHPNDLTNIEVRFNKPTGMHSFVNEPTLLPPFLERFSELCEYQHKRVITEFGTLIPELFSKSKLVYGHHYKIGVDIPQN